MVHLDIYIVPWPYRNCQLLYGRRALMFAEQTRDAMKPLRIEQLLARMKGEIVAGESSGHGAGARADGLLQ
jgi:hypothetical protein